MAVKDRTSISDEKVRELLIDGLNKGESYILNKSNFYEFVRINHKIERQRCLRLYDKYYLELQIERNKAKEGNSISEEIERKNKAILSKIERMEIASKIARGEAWKVGNNLIIPNGNDRLKALDYLSKIDGDYTAVKMDHTTKGESLNKQPDIAALAQSINNLANKE